MPQLLPALKDAALLRMLTAHRYRLSTLAEANSEPLADLRAQIAEAIAIIEEELSRRGLSVANLDPDALCSAA